MEGKHLKRGDPILYDRFEGLEPPMAGVVAGFTEHCDKPYVVIICDNQSYMTPARKLSLPENLHRKL